ncbi:hypothetical protein T552_00459 [Pneumocystis carinii B80]|uniref:RNA polymerase I-specific transcription initiation factor RRN3 n=1 Tax=Pneumocystis carinii (strain B80) TaxID=1408658 RepID=A0A0W4ZQU7_PNEC8|nr:hypothetical protein T552_00459 [Pneumocystis carinii B80]KTW30747.1 hypothetical protein T552_00459 [Pneumocystis carinii B80]
MVSAITSPFTKNQQQISSSDKSLLEKCKKQDKYMISLNGTSKKLFFSEDSNFSDDMVNKYIINVLETCDRGDKEAYEELRKKFSMDFESSEALSSVELKRLLFSLIHVASRLNLNYQSLINDILKMHWVERNDEFVSVYIQFLGTIASAHSGYIPLIIKMLVQTMALDSCSFVSLPGETPVSYDLIYDRVHFSLKYILDLVPISYTFLFSILAMEFPHKSHKTLLQVAYLKNLLRILEYVPVISAQVLGLIIDKIIQIDVEIQIELEDLDEGVDELTGIVTNEIHDNADKSLSHNDYNNIGENDQNEESLDVSEDHVYFQAITCIREMVDKLDCMLVVLFNYLDTIFSSSKDVNHKSESLADIIFGDLLRTFDSIILHTFRSRYTQFILFWASQINERYTNMFLGLILERALDDSRSHVSRSISCVYVASFVARAANLNKDMVRNAVNMLCGWINVFLDGWENEPTSSPAFVKKFGIFYFIVQSVLYIFCFRWRDLTDDDAQEHGIGWFKSLFILQRAIASELNPLKYCSSNIVSQFSEIAHQLNFLYCHPIIEQNKQSADISSAFYLQSSDHSKSTIHIDIQSYFPFDPYHLKLSRHFIDHIYIEWRSIDQLNHYQTIDSDDS